MRIEVVDRGATRELRRAVFRPGCCEARTGAMRFYRQRGFVAEGEEFLAEESGIPHYRMWRILEPSDAPTS